MRRMVFLAVGVAGLLVALGLAGLLTVRRVPRLVELTPTPGVVVTGPAIRPLGRTRNVTLDLGWCAGIARSLTPGQGVVAWTDADALGRTRVWRIERDGRPLCRYVESTTALSDSNRLLRGIALGAAALALLALAALLLGSWRTFQRG